MQFVLTAQKRELQGSSASRRLRRTGKVPCIIYGAGKSPEMIEIDHNQLYLGLRKEAFHSSLLTIELGNQREQTLLRDYQMHAYKPLVLHADFQRVDANKKLHQKIPLHFVNQDIAPGVKLEGGQIAHVMTEVEVSCLPQDLPEFIEVDLKDLTAGASLHLSQLALPQGVTAITHGHGNDDPTVASCIAKRGGSDEETVTTGDAAAAPPPVNEGK